MSDSHACERWYSGKKEVKMLKGKRSRCVAASTMCFLGLLLGPASTAYGDAVTLDDLFGGQTIVVGDKLFSDFELVSNRSKAAADPFSTTVEGFSAGPNDFGLTLNGLTNDSLIVTGNELIDFTFTFKVRALDDLRPITDASLALGAFQSEDPLAPVDIFEFLFDEGDTFLDSFGSVGVNPGRKSDSTQFDAREIVDVQKSISLGGGIGDDGQELTSFISKFQESFSETPVPEPSTFILVSTAMLAIIALIRRAA
jgi:hypothetical protein